MHFEDFESECTANSNALAGPGCATPRIDTGAVRTPSVTTLFGEKQVSRKDGKPSGGSGPHDRLTKPVPCVHGEFEN